VTRRNLAAVVLVAGLALPSVAAAQQTTTPTTARRHDWPRRRNAHQTTTATIRWKLDSGWPHRNCSPITSASRATRRGSGRRITPSAASSAHGTSAHTLACGYEIHVTIHSENP